MASWLDTHAQLMSGAAAAREAWSIPSHHLYDCWVGTYENGPGVVYLFYQFTCLRPYEPTEQDREATDWTAF